MNFKKIFSIALMAGVCGASAAESAAVLVRRDGAIPGIDKFAYKQSAEKVQLSQDFSKAGTVTMWVRPDGWDNQDKAWHFFITAGKVGKNTPYINLMRQVDGRMRFVYCLSAEAKKVADVFSTVPFQHGKWTHLAVSWKVLPSRNTHTRMCLYVDGKLAGQRIFPFVMGDKFPADWVIGDRKIWKPYSEYPTTLGRVECHPEELKADVISAMAQQVMKDGKLSIRNFELTPGSRGNVFTGKIDASLPAGYTMEVAFLDEFNKPTRRSYPVNADTRGFFELALDTPDDTVCTLFSVVTPAGKSPVWGFKKIVYAPWLPAVEPHFWQGSWIWQGQLGAPEAHRYFIRTFEANPDDITTVAFQWASDDRAEVFLNGKSIGKVNSWAVPKINDQLKSLLVPGKNVLAADAYNVGGGSGFFGELSLVHRDGSVSHIATDGTWKAWDKLVSGWNQPGFDASKWDNAYVVMRPPQPPYGEAPYRDFAVQPELTLAEKSKVNFADKKLTVSSVYNAPAKYAPGKVFMVLYRNGKELYRTQTNAELRDGKLQLTGQVVFPEVLLDENYDIKYESRGVKFAGHPGSVQVKMTSAPVELTAKVEKINGVPRLTVNGKPEALSLYRTPINFRNSTASYQFMSDFDRYGVRLSEINISFQQLMLPGGELNTDELELYLQSAMLYAPGSRFMLFFQTDAPKWYIEKNKSERYWHHKGELYQVSYASEKWRNDSNAFLRKTLEYIKTRPYYARILGFGFDGGEDGQFMQWTGRNINFLGDYSPAMKRYFQEKLKAKYGTVDRLNKAWQRPYKSFDEIEIPSAERRFGSAGKLFLDPVKDADITDFHRCFADSVADVMLGYAKIAKEVSENKRINAAYYGKFFSIAGYIEWGELAIERVLRSPYIDYLIAVEYNERCSGRPHSVSAPLGSYTLNNKIFVDEADLRTFLSGSKSWAYTGTALETVSVIRKMFVFNNAKGHGIHWYDLHGSVFAGPSILRAIQNVQKIAEQRATAPVKKADVAVIVDEGSFLHTTAAMKKVSAKSLLHIQNGNFGRMGTDFDLYFAGDMTRKEFPEYKMYVFMNLWAPTPEITKAVNALKRDGKVLVFLFNSGLIQNGTMSVDNVSRLTGITMGDRGAGNLSMVVEPGKTPAFMRGAFSEPQYCSAASGDRTAVPADPQAVGFGRFLNGNFTGQPGAVKKFADWTSVYCAVPYFTPAIWRSLARYAGAYIYTDDPEVMLYFGSDILGVHTANSGKTAVRWPEKADFTDAVTGDVYGRNTDVLELDMLPNETRIINVRAK